MERHSLDPHQFWPLLSPTSLMFHKRADLPFLVALPRRKERCCMSFFWCLCLGAINHPTTHGSYLAIHQVPFPFFQVPSTSALRVSMPASDGGGAVRLNVYDITNVASSSYSDAVVRANSIAREVGLGGVFHGAIDVYGVEWSYGFCQSGTGVRARAAPSKL